MSGIYIHIPFCAQACYYCDFHFSTNQQHKTTMVEMLCRELELRKEYLTERTISTLYFGGGTPSLLGREDFERLFKTIHEHYTLEQLSEITLEANPDDLTKEKIALLKSCGINRLSIGIQSFDDTQLRYMNRAHHSKQAIDAVKRAQDAGFENISIDLIYGIPSPNHILWKNDLDQAIALNVTHISSYCLTIEPATVFGRKKAKGTLAPENEEYNAQQFEILLESMALNNFEQYEVSNFSKPGYISKHNSSYWKDDHYLGIGPSAHSYDGESRQFNSASNQGYIDALKINNLPLTRELLDLKTKYNEYIMTRLRTKWGIDCSVLENKFGTFFANFTETINKYQHEGFLIKEENTLKLTKKGLLIADKITEDLFLI